MNPEIELLRRNLEGRRLAELRELFEATLARMNTGNATRSELPSVDSLANFTPPEEGAYFQLELQPPAELAKFLAGADAGELRGAALDRIERLVIDWLNRHYPPTAKLGYYLDYSEALFEAGKPAPLELWLTWRRHCNREDYPNEA